MGMNNECSQLFFTFVENATKDMKRMHQMWASIFLGTNTYPDSW
jgi:hypothetical protein